MIELRLYRAAFAPALVALAILMFSLERAPSPLPQGLPADVLFDGRVARATAEHLVRAHPDRRAGTPGDLSTAGMVLAELRRRGFSVSADRFRGDGRQLVNVVGRRVGASRRQVLVLAGRDAAGVPDRTGSAADTAALIQIARALEGRATHETLVIASVDGTTLGDVGASRLIARLPDASYVDAALVLSNLGSHDGQPLLVPWSTGDTRSGLRALRTAAQSVKQELGHAAGPGAGAMAQIARLAFPLGIGDQSPLIQHGADALRISGGGERPASGGTIDVDRLGALGRAALRFVSAVDAGGPLRERPSTFVSVAGKMLPGWAIALLAATLIFPALVASIDAFARARRRRHAVLPWWRWLLAGAAPFFVGYLAALFLALVGLAPNTPATPLPPSQNPLGAAGVVTLGLTVAAVALAWVFLRPRLAGVGGLRAAPGRLDDPGAGAATGLLLSLAVAAVWLINPFAALVLLPALHLWLLATTARVPPGPLAGALLVGIGALPLLGVALYYLVRLSLDPLAGAWYLLLLVTGHDIGFFSVLLGCLLASLLVGVAGIVRARARRPALEPVPSGPPLRGPGGYAGPGSLGGTESALRR